MVSRVGCQPPPLEGWHRGQSSTATIHVAPTFCVPWLRRPSATVAARLLLRASTARNQTFLPPRPRRPRLDPDHARAARIQCSLFLVVRTAVALRGHVGGGSLGWSSGCCWDRPAHADHGASALAERLRPHVPRAAARMRRSSVPRALGSSALPRRELDAFPADRRGVAGLLGWVRLRRVFPGKPAVDEMDRLS